MVPLISKDTSLLPGLRPVHKAALAAGVGLGVGTLSFLAQGRLPGDWNYLGNSGAVWLLPTFLMGALARRDGWAALAGVGTLTGCLVGYFGTGSLVSGVPYSTTAILFWAAVAVLGGPVFGIAGRWWRDERRPRHVLGLALLGGVFLAEGWYTLTYNPHLSVGWPLIVTGAVLPLLLGRSARDRLLALLALLPVVAVGAVFYALMTRVTF